MQSQRSQAAPEGRQRKPASVTPDSGDGPARPVPAVTGQAIALSGAEPLGSSSQPPHGEAIQPTRVRLERVSNILLIRLRRIGDVVTVTPCLRAVKETFPDAHLAVLVEKAAADVLLGNPYIDELIVLDKTTFKRWGRLGSLWAEIKFLLALRRKRFDLIINLHGGPRSSIQTLVSGARYRLGGFIDWHHWNWVYNIRTRPLVEMLGEHANHAHIVERHLATLKAAGIETRDHRLIMTVLPQAQTSLQRLLEERMVPAGERLVTIHPGSRSPAKRWKEERFAELADRLIEEFGVTVVLVSGPGEEAATRNVQGAMRRGAIDLGGRVSLQELAALFSRSSLYIGLDSGALHVAAALGVPLVALLGPTTDAWRPWTEHGLVVRAPSPCAGPGGSRPGDPASCMDAISVAQVFDAILRLRASQHLDW